MTRHEWVQRLSLSLAVNMTGCDAARVAFREASSVEKEFPDFFDKTSDTEDIASALRGIEASCSADGGMK